jgi:hypothetical protein
MYVAAANTLGALMVMSGALLLLFAICLLAAVLRVSAPSRHI